MYISANRKSIRHKNMIYGIRGARSPNFEIPVQFLHETLQPYWNACVLRDITSLKVSLIASMHGVEHYVQLVLCSIRHWIKYLCLIITKFWSALSRLKAFESTIEKPLLYTEHCHTVWCLLVCITLKAVTYLSTVALYLIKCKVSYIKQSLLCSHQKCWQQAL